MVAAAAAPMEEMVERTGTNERERNRGEERAREAKGWGI